MEAVKDVPLVTLKPSTRTVNILVRISGKDSPELRQTYDATHDYSYWKYDDERNPDG